MEIKQSNLLLTKNIGDDEFLSYSDDLKKIKQQKKNHQKEIDFIYTASFCELLKTYSEDFAIIKQQNKKNLEKGKILFEYIEQGFISENYKNHISYFREGLLSKTDEIFISYVKNSTGETKELKLNNMEDVISNLSEKEGYTSIIINEKILNYSLFLFLCTHTKQYPTQIESILNYIEENKQYEFIQESIDRYDSNIKDIVSTLFIVRSSLFYKLIKNYEQKKRLEILSIALSANYGRKIYSFADDILLNYIWSLKQKILDLNKDCAFNISVLTNKKIK